ncbi:MAG TPA: hypothetical protein VEV17_08385 [Bryobacteraceae bacterium]|nr:hypothetical protein [Bryobacteraceae bacterium]
MRQRNLVLSIVTALFVAAYFFWFTKDTLHSYFDPDDCMTMYRAWSNSAGALLKANLLFFLNSPFYRPMTCVWYRLVYDYAGFNPVAFHAASMALLAANVWFTYCAARRLSGSREAGALAALLISYHGRFASLNYDTAYSYDVTCFFFYFATVVYYLRTRSRGRPLGWLQLTVLSALYICALNCKELAVSLPLFLLLYEWFYHRPALGSWRDVWRWAITDARPVVWTGLLTLLFVVGRMTTGVGLIDNPEFQPLFTWDRFMTTSRTFVSALLLQRDLLPAAAVLLLWLLLLIIAWASKSPALKFAWLFFMLSVIPVAFIPPRGPGQYYIPFFGWILYAVTALVDGTKYLVSKLTGALRIAPARPVVLFVAVAAFMIYVNRPYTWAGVSAISLEGEQYRSIIEQVHQLRPSLRPGARVLFLNDPLDDAYQMMFLMRLSYHDDSLVIDRAKLMTPPPGATQIAAYDSVFDFYRGRFFAGPLSRQQKDGPSIIFDDWGRSSVYHSNWDPVTREHPARPGETVIAMVSNLGETMPPTPPGQPFPHDPFARVVSPVEVSVDKQVVPIGNKLGWPGMKNAYRLDFQIPRHVGSEEPPVVITCHGRTGPAEQIPVRE